MFCIFPDSLIPKVSAQKWATGQSFIRKEITTYRIGTLTKQTVQIVWIRIVKKLSFENKQPVMVANFFFHFFFRKLEKDDASTRPLWNTIGLRTLEKRKEENRRKFFRASSSPDFQIKNEKNLHGPFCPQPYRCR